MINAILVLLATAIFMFGCELTDNTSSKNTQELNLPKETDYNEEKDDQSGSDES